MADNNRRLALTVFLLRVEDTFDLTNQGLVCAPFFTFPATGKFRGFTAMVTVQPPNGPAFETEACFSVTHFKILDLAAPADKRWQIVTCLGRIAKHSVPVGSVIVCDKAVRQRLMPPV